MTPSTRAAAAVSSTRSARERVGVGVGIVGALVAAGRDQHVHLGAGVGPARERAAGGDLGIVGMRVDREHALRDVVVVDHVSPPRSSSNAAIVARDVVVVDVLVRHEADRARVDRAARARPRPRAAR